MKRVLFISVLALCTAVTPTAAGYSTGGGFSAPGYGARAWGMAGAAVAFGSDEGAVYWNPALLALLDRARLGLAYIDLIPGTDARQSHVAYARVLKPGVEEEPGLAFATHAVGALYTNLRIELADGRDYAENTLRLAYAYTPEYFVTIALAFNALLSTSDLTGFDNKGTAVDVGLRLALSDRLNAGAIMRNAFSNLEDDANFDQTLPRVFTFGAAYAPLDDLVFEGDVSLAFGGISRIAAGGQYVLFSDVLALRAGVATVTTGESRTIPYFGFGIQVRRFRVDYNGNFDAEDAFGDTHRFSLGVGL